jgi:hypothetical protein
MTAPDAGNEMMGRDTKLGRKVTTPRLDLLLIGGREVAPGFGTKGLSGGGSCSVMVDGADDEETETEVRCRREGEDSA